MLESNDAIFNELSKDISNDIVVEKYFDYDFKILFYSRMDIGHKQTLSLVYDTLNKFTYLDYRTDNIIEIRIKFKYRPSYLMLHQTYYALKRDLNAAMGVSIASRTATINSLEKFFMVIFGSDFKRFDRLKETHSYIKNRYDGTLEKAYTILVKKLSNYHQDNIMQCTKYFNNLKFRQPIDAEFTIWKIRPSRLKLFTKDDIDEFKRTKYKERYAFNLKTDFMVWYGSFINYKTTGEVSFIAKLKDRDFNEFVWASMLFENATKCAIFINENLILRDANSYDFLKQLYEDLNIPKTNRLRRRIT